MCKVHNIQAVASSINMAMVLAICRKKASLAANTLYVEDVVRRRALSIASSHRKSTFMNMTSRACCTKCDHGQDSRSTNALSTRQWYSIPIRIPQHLISCMKGPQCHVHLLRNLHPLRAIILGTSRLAHPQTEEDLFRPYQDIISRAGSIAIRSSARSARRVLVLDN